MPNNDWDVNRKLIFSKLEDIETLLKDIQGRLNKHSIEIAQLSVKSTVWGAAGGILAAVGILMIKFLGS